MQAVLDHLTADEEITLLGAGQSNRRPWGHRDREGYVAAPHLRLRAAGLDLTIQAIVGAAGDTHGAAGSQSIVTVAEGLTDRDWRNGELRLVQHEHGDSTFSSKRRGHAKILDNFGVATNTTAVGGTLAFDHDNEWVIWPSHNRKNGSQVHFTGVDLPNGLDANRVYWVRDAERDRFKVSEDPHGAVKTFSDNGTGDRVAVARAFLFVQWVSEFQANATVTFSDAAGSLQLNWPGFDMPAGSTVSFTSSGTLPPNVTANTTYYIVLFAGFVLLSATYGGAPLANVGLGTPTITGAPEVLAFVSGYVHLHDRFNSYDNVQVVTPYQPIEPGDFPAGVPVVPGFTLDADVTSYSDAGLVLPFAWNEGIEGHGKAGTAATVSGLVVTFNGGVTAEDKVFADGFIRVGPSKGIVDTNNTTTATVKAWIPGAPPAGAHSWEMHLPHHRNNPHHFTAGEGFLYPSDDMQPGGGSALSPGTVYSRPRGVLVGSYVGRQLQPCAIGAAINDDLVAQLKVAVGGDLILSVPSPGILRIQRANSASDPTTGLIQFEAFLRAGYVVRIAGSTGTTVINGDFRCVVMGHTFGGVGSFIDLAQLSPLDRAVPAAIGDAAAPAGATITRLFWEPQHRFGSMLENGWRVATSLGRRVLWVHLGINSSGQIPASVNNAFSFQGKLGWFDDDLNLTWTPSDPDSNAVRFARLATFIAPRAVHATFGASKKLKYVAADIWNMEADALTPVGRELAQRTVSTFVSWLRGIVDAADLSPYPKGAKLPVHWAQISPVPYELNGEVSQYPGFIFTGDNLGLVNAALDRWKAFDGFGASVNTDAAGKLDGTTFFGADPLHFNGFGEAANGKAAAAEILRLIEFAFSFSLGKSATEIANQALMLAAESAALANLEIDDGTEAMRLCLAAFRDALDAVLAYHPWSFATHHAAWVKVTNDSTLWDFAYAVPPDCLKPTGVFDPSASDDTQDRATDEPTSQPSRERTDLEGHRILGTDQDNAIVRYTRRNVDVGVMDPEVRSGLAWRIVHFIAPGLLKGKDGRKLSQDALGMSEALLARAAASNTAYQQDIKPPQGTCEWLPKRRTDL